MERINIVDFESKSDISKKTKKPYNYLEIKLDDNQTYRLFGDLAEIVETGGVGFYNASFQPSPTNPKFQQISAIAALDGSESPAAAPQTPKPVPQQTRAFKGKEGPSTDDSILFQVGLKVAGEMLAGSGASAKDVSKYANELYDEAKRKLDPSFGVPF